MSHINDEPLTAVNVIRCVYLVRVATKRGDREAARRWQATVDAWLERTRAVPRDAVCTTTALRAAQ